VVPAARTILIDGLADPAAFARDLSDWNVWDHSWCELEVNSGLEWRLMWRVGSIESQVEADCDGAAP
jgi:hypothetical protein